MKRYIFIGLLILIIAGCKPGKHCFVSMQEKQLYDIPSIDNRPSINGFFELTIFSDDFDNTVWVSPEKNCVTLAKESDHVYAGKYALHVKWDKITGGCKWIGIGFGWNNWQPKDMTDIIGDAAVQMQVRAVKGSFSNLPVAFAFEDYTGVQSYCGFTREQASGTFNDTSWTSVTIPLKDFPFRRNDADLGKMKQFIIQLEADGDIFLDEIKLISYNHEK